MDKYTKEQNELALVTVLELEGLFKMYRYRIITQQQFTQSVEDTTETFKERFNKQLTENSVEKT